jgi:hypothetical protein
MIGASHAESLLDSGEEEIGAANQIIVEWKRYGGCLAFTPTVLNGA